MFCWGQSTLSLKVTEVCFRTEGNLLKEFLSRKLLINVNQITFKINCL